MAIKIGSNIQSLEAQRRLGESTAALSKTFERLSSGLRINRASDDAAGLSVATGLNAKTRIFTKAIQNGNDGYSLLSIADSAVENLTSIVTRVRELAEQSANGSYSTKQRSAMDGEAQALSKEYSRITQSTSFNGINIFDGSLGDGLTLQLGIGTDGMLKSGVGGAIGTGTFGASATYDTSGGFTNGVTVGDLNGDGIQDLAVSYYDGGGGATILLGDGNGSFTVGTKYRMDAAFTSQISLGDLNGDGILDLITGGNTSSGTGSVSIRIGKGDGTFGALKTLDGSEGSVNGISLGDINGDGSLDIVAAGEDYLNDRGLATIYFGTGNGTFANATTMVTDSGYSKDVKLADLNADGILDLVTSGSSSSSTGEASVFIGKGNGTFGARTSYAAEAQASFSLALGDLNGDGVIDLVTSGYGAYPDGGVATVRYGTGNGKFGTSTTYSLAIPYDQSHKMILGDINGDSRLDILVAGYDNNSIISVLTGNKNGGFDDVSKIQMEGAESYDVNIGDFNGDGVVDLVSANNGSVGVTTRMSVTKQGIGALQQFSLKTQSSSLQSMGMLDRTLANLAKQRGIIGSNQSRLTTAIQNLTTESENFKAAESRITDTDIAKDSAELVRLQILQQASAAVLSQANQQPALALTLLR